MTCDTGHTLLHAMTHALACAQQTLTGLHLHMRLFASCCSRLKHTQVGCIQKWRPHCDWRALEGLPVAEQASAEAGPAKSWG